MSLLAKGQQPCVVQGGCLVSQRSAPLCGSRGLSCQAKVSTPVWVKGAVLSAKGQHPCVGQGDCLVSQRSAPLCGSRGLSCQPKVSTSVWVKGDVLSAKGQHPCVGQGDCLVRQRSAPLRGSRGLSCQPKVSSPVLLIFISNSKNKWNINKQVMLTKGVSFDQNNASRLSVPSVKNQNFLCCQWETQVRFSGTSLSNSPPNHHVQVYRPLQKNWNVPVLIKH